ncbi:DUF3667 domain-containing protein [Flavobacterium sp. Sd200]|uniref:DUF3667 domain-containing protein n=1 Tax=Flavobacterium sp. Sd200 TaxID=2692211 RepID=UPI001368326D|nr:DUF3667 domain-containing protein [Flavobacterium sp. Sd200]MXN91657.1 DUF3667 domain-containing protein [Flavobacterium sp. Sd200]
MTTNCLNCNEVISGKFCNNCSQATSTHRFSLYHVFQHDFIHGIFHFDKGFFYTIKELFTRPGHSIREYVQGKRVKHFNYFSTIILLITIGYFLRKWAKFDASVFYEDKTAIEGVLKVLKHYSKITVFLHIPIISLVSYLVFKKSKQNYTENLVLNLYLLCGTLAISFILIICMIFSDNIDFLFYVNHFLTALTFLYVIIFYYQYFSVFDFKKHQLIIRVVIVSILYLLTKQIINNILNIIGLKYFN